MKKECLGERAKTRNMESAPLVFIQRRWRHSVTGFRTRMRQSCLRSQGLSTTSKLFNSDSTRVSEPVVSHMVSGSCCHHKILAGCWLDPCLRRPVSTRDLQRSATTAGGVTCRPVFAVLRGFGGAGYQWQSACAAQTRDSGGKCYIACPSGFCRSAEIR